MKRNETLLYATTYMNLENISQTQNIYFCMIPRWNDEKVLEIDIGDNHTIFYS